MLMERLRRFMIGRYGGDQLNVALLLLGVVLSLCAQLFPGALYWVVYVAADALLFWALFRMFSRNIPARQRENQAFWKLWGPVKSWFQFQQRKFRQRREYKYFKCPACKQRLRAPRGRGEIEVTCQKCGKVFRTRC